MKIRPLPIFSILALCIAGPLRADEAGPDAGTVQLFLDNRAIGTEKFEIDVRGDSLIINAITFQIMPRHEADGRPVTLEKQLGIVTGAFDFELRNYLSRSMFRGDTLVRGVLPSEGDTLYTVYRELNRAGVADRLVLPPGRLFVVDSPPLFTTFDLMCRALHGKTFDQRPLLLLMLGTPDTVLVSTVTDLGTETIRWGARPVQARKLDFSNERMKFIAWVSPAGRLLKLEETNVGLRAEREPPPVRRRTTKRAG